MCNMNTFPIMQKYAATQSVAQMSNYTGSLCGDSNMGSSDRLHSF